METTTRSLSDNTVYSPISVEVGFADNLAIANLASKIYAKKTDFESVRTGRTNDDENNIDQKIKLDIGDKTMIKQKTHEVEKGSKISSPDKTEDDKLQGQIEDQIYLNQFSANEYIWLCQETLSGNFNSFKKLDKGKQSEFLVKLYRTTDTMSDNVIDALLPYVQIATLEFTFRFGSIDSLGAAKKMSFLKRLASESSQESDQLLIPLLLVTDEAMIANCPLDTLLKLRKKESLGQRFFENLSQSNNGGPLSKDQFKKLGVLSIKISTLCFAYFLERSGDLYKRSLEEHLAFSRNDLNNIDGLKKREKDLIYQGFQQKGLVSQAQQPTALSTHDQLKKDINDILASALALAAEYKASIKKP